MSNHGWVVEVPVHDTPDSPKAVIRLSMWNSLISKGMHPLLSVNNKGYVVGYNPANRRYYRVARLIANANSTQEVILVKPNELLLIEENIILVNPPEKTITYALETFDPNFSSIDEVEYEWDWGTLKELHIDLENGTITEKGNTKNNNGTS